MAYSQFESLEQAIDAFNLSIVEANFFPQLQSTEPSDILTAFLKRSIPIVSAASEKARSEGIYGQCVAEMVAGQRFNQSKHLENTIVYGCVSNGLL
jgi:hypothetical protein